MILQRKIVFTKVLTTPTSVNAIFRVNETRKCYTKRSLNTATEGSVSLRWTNYKINMVKKLW